MEVHNTFFLKKEQVMISPVYKNSEAASAKVCSYKTP